MEISIYNIAGQKIRTLLSQEVPDGTHSIVWNGENDHGSTAASGIYIFKLEAGKTAMSHRMMLVR